MWLYLPGQGRYILSLVPHQGFQKLGVVRDNVISFPANGQQYELRAYSPIVGAGGAWNLYILHDPSYHGDFENAAVSVNKALPPGTLFVGLGVGRLDNLLPK